MRLLAASGAARASLGDGELLLARWPRRSSVDLAAGMARATFEVRGDAGHVQVVVGARRRAKAQQAYEQALEDQEDEEELMGWSRYFYRPWELKPVILGAFSSRSGSSDKVAGVSGGEAEEEEPVWDLEALFFLPGGDARRPAVLLGDPRTLPEYEALCMRRDAEAKGEYSRWRLRVFIGLALGGAVIAGAARLAKSVRVSQSYAHVKRALQAHPQVAAVLGPGARVESSSGTFGTRYIDARLRLVGSGGRVADVEVSATRDGPGASLAQRPWRVALARMSAGGLTHNLDRAAF